MKTLYDSALRAQRRDMDDLRAAIGDAAGRVAEADLQRQAVCDAMARESRVAAGDWTFSPAPYFALARSRREQLDEARRLADAELAVLRQKAAERYGALRALESAADGYREQALRDADDAQQAAVDDIVGARFARVLDRARRARAVPGTSR